MATTVDKREETRWALHDKRVALARYLQALLAKEPDDPDLVRIEFGRAKIEFELTVSILSELSSGQPIQLPSDATIDALRNSVAVLSHAIAASAALGDMIKAADQVIKVWPD